MRVNGERESSSASSGSPGRVFVGTSGWVYPDWIGTVYPHSLKTREAFAHYVQHFTTVELNSTFYHVPRETTVATWRAMGGEGFTWSVKAWRWLTHIKRLRGVKADLKAFLTRVGPLIERGVVLVQLPPSFKQDLTRLERFLKWWPGTLRLAIEFRHNSWFTEATYAVLRQHGVALIGVDAPGIMRVWDVWTAPFAYFRLHGSSQWYQHDYRAAELHTLANAVAAHRQDGDVYVYFDNTAGGYAFHNALAFRRLYQHLPLH